MLKQHVLPFTVQQKIRKVLKNKHLNFIKIKNKVIIIIIIIIITIIIKYYYYCYYY